MLSLRKIALRKCAPFQTMHHRHTHTEQRKLFECHSRRIECDAVVVSSWNAFSTSVTLVRSLCFLLSYALSLFILVFECCSFALRFNSLIELSFTFTALTFLNGSSAPSFSNIFSFSPFLFARSSVCSLSFSLVARKESFQWLLSRLLFLTFSSYFVAFSAIFPSRRIYIEC